MSRHAIERAKERYGIDLDVSLVINQIRANQAKMSHRLTKQKAVYQVNHHGTQILVLYHRGQQAVITCLPLEHIGAEYRRNGITRILMQEELMRRNLEAINGQREIPIGIGEALGDESIDLEEVAPPEFLQQYTIKEAIIEQPVRAQVWVPDHWRIRLILWFARRLDIKIEVVV